MALDKNNSGYLTKNELICQYKQIFNIDTINQIDNVYNYISYKDFINATINKLLVNDKINEIFNIFVNKNGKININNVKNIIKNDVK
jgi:Ca2+-binding EF-hand superfamily protein